MTDLNMKPKQTDETPIGVQLLVLIPMMVVLFTICARVL